MAQPRPNTWETPLLRRLALKPLGTGEPDNTDVRRWRARLIRKGFVVDAQGEFDSRLQNATLVAQHWAGVKADGLVGPLTWKAVGKKKRSKRPINVIRHVVGKKPRIVDVRRGQLGFARNAGKSWGQRDRGSLRYKLGHYTGGPASFQADSNFHVHTGYLSPGGAPAIAYCIGVDKDGTIFVFNDWHDVTWHCDGGFNTVTLGVVWRGGTEGPGLAQRKSLTWLWNALSAGDFGFGFPPTTRASTTHRHVNSTSCPGEKGEAFYRELAGTNFTASPRR